MAVAAPSRDTILMDGVDRAVRMWRQARSVLVLTGAGISVPSGIPDFHSPGGLWTKYNPNEVASFGALRSRPEKVWTFLLDAAGIMTSAEPNPAHIALAELEKNGLISGIVTQNIDGLHQRAGSGHVVEFHGNIRRFYCMDCRSDHAPERFVNARPEDRPWVCECGGVIRPGLVFYGEGIPPEAMSGAVRLAEKADLAVIVGTSGQVAPANLIPHQVKSRGGQVLEINLGSTAYGSTSDVKLDAGAEIVLPMIAEALIRETQ